MLTNILASKAMLNYFRLADLKTLKKEKDLSTFARFAWARALPINQTIFDQHLNVSLSRRSVRLATNESVIKQEILLKSFKNIG